MKFSNLSAAESEILSKINEGCKTFEMLKNTMPFNEKTLTQNLEQLLAKHILVYNSNSKEYDYDTPINGQVIILDGNIMLPTTIIKTNDKLLVSRGQWYEFPLDFDVRRIIWNVSLPDKNNSTLAELIKNSITKERKSKIIQSPELLQLKNKIIPWSKHIGLQLNTVGDELSDINIIFKQILYLDSSKTMSTEFKGFTVKSEIKTPEILTELKTSVDERNFQNISLNRIFNITDFIFSGNEIPYEITKESVSYAKITGIRSNYELTYFTFTKDGKTEKIDTEQFDCLESLILKIKEFFNNCVEPMLEQLDFILEE